MQANGLGDQIRHHRQEANVITDIDLRYLPPNARNGETSKGLAHRLDGDRDKRNGLVFKHIRYTHIGGEKRIILHVFGHKRNLTGHDPLGDLSRNVGGAIVHRTRR